MATQSLSRPRIAPHLRVKISPVASRIAHHKKLDISQLKGSGPNGRIVRADVLFAIQRLAGEPVLEAPPMPAMPQVEPPTSLLASATPHMVEKLSGMRKTIARRLTVSKQEVPHIYLTVDVQIEKILKLRTELNADLSSRGVKLSVNDMLIKALAVALREVPQCNVQFAGDQLLKFSRADISVAVSIPGGLITPIISGADGKGVGAISTEMKDLVERAKNGKLKPEEYQGGTASLSNLGMFGIKQFDAVINPPQAMILAVGAGEKRALVRGDELTISTMLTATGSFDHRAVDGADGARLMYSFKTLLEAPLSLLA